MNERLQKERQAAYDREMQARRERDNAPKPYKDPRSEKDREKELKYIIERMGFKRMLEDVKRNIWDGRGKITSDFGPDNAYHQLRFIGRESIYDTSSDNKWTVISKDYHLKLGATREERSTLIYLDSTWRNEKYQFGDPNAAGNIQRALLDAAYQTK